MKQEPPEIVAEIIMRRSAAPECASLVLEGEKDCKFFKGRVTTPLQCQVYNAHGKKNVAKVIGRTVEKGIPGVLGIIDRDFDLHLGKDRSGEHILYTDKNDFESTAVACDCFRKFAVENFDNDPVVKGLIGSSSPTSIASFFMRLAGRIGLLRFLDQKHNWQFRFRELEVESFVEPAKMEIDLNAMIAQVFSVSPEPQVSTDEATESYLEAIGKLNDEELEQFCSGHDLTALMAHALRDGKCANYPESINRETIEKNLRMCLDLKSTTLFVSIIEWQKNNLPFSFFAA